MSKTCLITGASGGVAHALAQQLRADGWRLALAGRDRSRIESESSDVVVETDVSTQDGAALAVERAAEAFDRPPDALVNCAGGIVIAALARTSEQQYRGCLAANLDTAFFLARAYAPMISKSDRGGSMVLFSSVAAGMGVGNHAAIAIAKGGVEALVRSLAADFSSGGLRVNAIAPGLMETPMTERMLSNDAARKQIAAQYPLGRHGEAEDAARLAAWLISDQSSWITGQIIGLDGGFSAVRPFLKG